MTLCKIKPVSGYQRCRAITRTLVQSSVLRWSAIDQPTIWRMGCGMEFRSCEPCLHPCPLVRHERVRENLSVPLSAEGHWLIEAHPHINASLRRHVDTCFMPDRVIIVTP